jgi:uncharacterized protein (DUF2249 family)
MTFTLKTKIATALKERPDLKEILPAFHPAFKKLQNPILARTLTRLVTVEDAAKIAGVNPEAMLAVMNTPGVPQDLPPRSANTEPAPRPPWYETDRITELDVRPQLAAGDDPFKIIIAATRELPAGQILELIASFEPAPIIRVLQKQGWASWLRWEGEACHVAFWYAKQKQADGGTGVVVPSERLEKLAAGWVIDVRGLEPPQPMVYVLRTLEDAELVLPLTIKHQRVPSVLFSHLEDTDYKWSTKEHEDGVDIVIERADS